MKKKNLFLCLLVSCLSLTLLSSCGGSDGPSDPPVDTGKPVVSALKPENNTVLYFGDKFNVTANVADEGGLSSYKIDIHIADHPGGHTRGTRGIVVYSYNTDKPLTGNQATINEMIDLPVSVPGNDLLIYQAGQYHIVLYVIDKAGNQTVTVRTVTINQKS